MIRIYGTLGPACDKAETLEEMLNLGMTGLRLNLSHVSLREAAGELRHLREAEARCGKQAELLIDMQGPELRIGKLPSPLLFRAGETVDLDALPFPEAVREKRSACPPSPRRTAATSPRRKKWAFRH